MLSIEQEGCWVFLMSGVGTEEAACRIGRGKRVARNEGGSDERRSMEGPTPLRRHGDHPGRERAQGCKESESSVVS